MRLPPIPRLPLQMTAPRPGAEGVVLRATILRLMRVAGLWHLSRRGAQNQALSAGLTLKDVVIVLSPPTAHAAGVPWHLAQAPWYQTTGAAP